jgi:cytochrome c peroxidase
MVFAGYGEERFSHFRKTFGYANSPLDGLWLRAPYLHNGSVPTLRDLLEPSDKRPKTFYRCYDVYDQNKVGFVADVSNEKGREYFEYNTDEPGNSNKGHEGKRYGTELPVAEKDALIEYLKTF